MNNELPHDAAVERAVLGAVLLQPKVLPLVAAYLTEDDFFVPRHRAYWRGMLGLHQQGLGIDNVTLAAALGPDLERLGGAAALVGVLEEGCTAGHAESYARMVIGHAQRRRLLGVASEIGAMVRETEDAEFALELAQQAVGRIARKNTGNVIRPLGHLTREYVRELFAAVEAADLAGGKVEVKGRSTGYPAIDELVVALRGGELIVMGARPSMGKTALALGVAERMARAAPEGSAVAFFSGEQPGPDISMRWLSQVSGVDSMRMQRREVTDGEIAQLVKAVGDSERVPLLIDDTSAPTIGHVCNRARMLALEHKLVLVVVDYLQLLRAPEQADPRLEVTEISRRLKALARDLDVPVLALSQLNRGLESRQNKRPVLSDLRESGAIEQDADQVWFLHREAKYDDRQDQNVGVAELIVAKLRNGRLGTARLRFDRGRFLDLEEQVPLALATKRRPVLADLVRAALRQPMEVDELARIVRGQGWEGTSRDLWVALDDLGVVEHEGILTMP